MRLWHDDIRRPPDDSWTWVRTNEAAKARLVSYDVVEISLDHDLGLHDADPDMENAHLIIGQDKENTGLDLVDWMIARGLVPERVTVHSMNVVGAQRMVKTLTHRGYAARHIPYQHPTN